jgi:hypothetical protein
MRITLAIPACVFATSAHADHWTAKVAQTRYAVDACLSSLATRFQRTEPSAISDDLHRPDENPCAGAQVPVVGADRQT